jgi:WD40 repeat protein
MLGWAKAHCVHLCDAVTLKPLRSAAAHEQEVRAAAFGVDGNTLVSAASDDGFVRLWETATGKALTSLAGLGDYIYALAASPDGRQLAVGTGTNKKTIWLFDAATGKLIRNIAARDGVTSLAFSGDGKTLASGHSKHVRLWDVSTGRLLRTFPGGTESWERVYVLASDGRTLAVENGHDGVVQLYETAVGKQLRAIHGNSHAVHAIAFAPDLTREAVAARERLRKIDMKVIRPR